MGIEEEVGKGELGTGVEMGSFWGDSGGGGKGGLRTGFWERVCGVCERER